MMNIGGFYIFNNRAKNQFYNIKNSKSHNINIIYISS